MPAIASLGNWGYLKAICTAIVLSLLIAFIEIPSRAKTPSLRSVLVGQSFFYFGVLAVGNVVTTLLASVAVVKQMPSSLADFHFLLSAFFGVFAFQAVLKNTNVTMFDKGVLTIQDWTEKALNGAAAAALDCQERMKQQEENRLISKLMQNSDADINTRILNKFGAGKVAELDAAAKASGADPKLYKLFQLITTLSASERAVLLK